VQVDPVETQSDLNLYAYVRNDPANLFDPSGGDAAVKKWDSGHVQITIPIHFSGTAASTANVSAVKGNIEGRWSGQVGRFNVQTIVDVKSASSRFDPEVNQIELVDDPGGENSSTQYGRIGRWNVAETRGANVRFRSGLQGPARQGADSPAHEAGHLMGVGDAEDYEGTGIAGPASPLMGAPTADMSRHSAVSEDDINLIIQGGLRTATGDERAAEVRVTNCGKQPYPQCK
jgi:uncharacterized protein RhaS with RHS repeats